MSVAALIRAMASAGAPPEAIAIAVEAIEAAQAGDAERRAKRAHQKRAERERMATVARQSHDMVATVAQKGSPERPSELDSKPTEFNQNPSKNPPTGVKKVPGENRLIAAGVTEALLADWRRVRVAKRAGPITETVADGLIREAKLAGMSPAEAVRAAVERGWQGFRHGWMNDSRATGPPNRPKGDGMAALDELISRTEARNGSFDNHQAPVLRLAGTG